MGGRGATSAGGNASNSWRNENPKYYEKTAGGVYFYDSPGTFGQAIEKEVYDKLPKYAKESVLQANTNGVSTSAWFMTENGIAYLNTEKSDFLAEVRYHKNQLRNANGFSGNVDDYDIDWSV